MTPSMTTALRSSGAPNRSGLPCSSLSSCWSFDSFSYTTFHARSLYTLQFCKISRKTVQRVVAAGRAPVPVSRPHEGLEVGAGQLEARGDGGRRPVDRVEPVGVHVVREAARAADPGDEHDVLPGNLEIRHALLHRGE